MSSLDRKLGKFRRSNNWRDEFEYLDVNNVEHSIMALLKKHRKKRYVFETSKQFESLDHGELCFRLMVLMENQLKAMQPGAIEADDETLNKYLLNRELVNASGKECVRNNI